MVVMYSNCWRGYEQAFMCHDLDGAMNYIKEVGGEEFKDYLGRIEPNTYKCRHGKIKIYFGTEEKMPLFVKNRFAEPNKFDWFC